VLHGAVLGLVGSSFLRMNNELEKGKDPEQVVKDALEKQPSDSPSGDK
jgi:hypothetical protein